MLYVEKVEILGKKFGIVERIVREWWIKLDLLKLVFNFLI